MNWNKSWESINPAWLSCSAEDIRVYYHAEHGHWEMVTFELVTKSPSWSAQGGVNFQYEVRNGALATATTAKLFWASGTTTANIISGAPVIFTQNIPVGASGLSAVINVPAANFANPPATATHVLLVLDPDNLVQESDEGNNVLALALRPDLAAVSFTWNTNQGGADFQYAISNAPLAQATAAKLFWATGTNTSDIISANAPFITAIYSMDLPAGSFGTTVARFPASMFDSHPAGATHVLAVLDYDNVAVESDESNNSKALALNLPVVVLVRGALGPFPDNWNTAVYWSRVAASLGTDFDVWVCTTVTGAQHVEAESVALHNFINAKLAERGRLGLPHLQKVSIVAHSYGGLITRSYLHGKRVGRYPNDPAVDKVIMLCTPNCGSYLADSGLRAIPALSYDAALPCLTEAWVQSVFNRYCNDRSPTTPFYLFGAAGGSGWATYRTLFNWPPGIQNPNDGLVTVASAHGVRWASPGFRIAERQVGAVYEVTTADDHTSIKSNPSVLSSIRSILLGRGTSYFSPAQARQPKDGGDGASGFALVSLTDGIIQASGVQYATVPIDDCPSVAFSLICTNGEIGLSLTAPGGSLIDPGTTNAGIAYSQITNQAAVNISYVINNPAVGLWTANIHAAPSLTNATAWNFLVTEQSGLTIVPTTEYFQLAGNVAVSAMLANGTQAVSGAILSATVQRPDITTDQLPLYDDGAHGDGAASDGVYANGYTLSTNAGIYSVRYLATGTSTLGHAFARIGGGSFQIAPRTAWLSGAYLDQGVDLGPPPGLEEIAVNVGVQVATAGVYYVSAVLADAAGNELGSAAAAPTALAAGTTNLTLHFDADGLRRSTNDGPYVLTSVVLWDDSSGLSLRADYATNAYSTAVYPRTNFSDRLPAQAVSDLSAASVGSQSVVLRWTAPDNEGNAAAAYSVRYRKGGLWPGVWDTATAVAASPIPALPGTPQTLAVAGLDIGNTYYFGLKSTDQAGNESELSNVQMVRLLSAITAARVLTNGQFQCSFAGEAGRSYIVQVSTNLAQWLPLSTNMIGFTNSSFVFTDSQAASYRQRFYRSLQQP
jgi:hypothetical protein